ncbi:MAG: DUF177 domain-containing protein [Coriobacteriia bacterium]|nr:DUF177 domain-containing protein [Coriobacteriia bacterium]
MFSQTNIRLVLDDHDAVLHLNDSFDIAEFVVEDLEFKPLGPAYYDLDLTYTGDGVLALGVVTLDVSAPCVRCLEEFPLRINSEVQTLFYLDPTVDDAGDPLPFIDDEGNISLLDELYEDLRMETPFAPLHDRDCLGLCPKCGVNLNVETCTCSHEIDPTHPLAGLIGLIGEDGHADEEDSE